MLTVIEMLDEYSVYDLIELLRKEPNQNMKISDWYNKQINALEYNVDEDQTRMEI